MPPAARRAFPILSCLAVLLACVWLLPDAPAAARGKSAQTVDLQRWGVPDDGQFGMPRPYGLAAYDGRLRGNRYTLEVLTAASVAGDAERARAHFHVDADWPVEFRATLADYRAAADTFDRGHLACAANHPATQAEMDDTFVLSNMALQHKALNRGLMRQVEDELRDLARSEEVLAVWVATMPLLMPDEAPDRGQPTSATVTLHYAGPNHVPVPTHFGKTALFLSRRGQVTLRSWCFPNRAPAAGRSLDDYRCTVDYLEHWAGLNFWEGIPEPQQSRLEAGE